MQSLISSFLVVIQPQHLLILYLCSLLGVVLGAIPGLSGGTGIALILPMTFSLSSEVSFCMLLGMYVGGISGSFISSVLVGIPGSAQSIATCYDGYPLTKNGQASKALSIGITASFLGTFLSVVIATIFSKLVADLALMMGPWEYFSLVFMAISLVIGLSKGSIYKGLLGAFIGIWLATVGVDPVSAHSRFTFGNYNLYSGVNAIAMLMGTFALQSVAMSYAFGQQKMPKVDINGLKGFGLTAKDFAANLKAIVVSFFLGLWIGFLPGLGGGVANVVAYGQAKKMSKTPEKFGEGSEEGLWASEVSNNASIGGAIIPLISLGIPGDGTGVMLLSALTIHGLQAGPLFIQDHPDLAYLVFTAILVSAVLVFLTQLVTKRWFPYLLNVPYHYLYGAIMVICFFGAFSTTTTMFSIYQLIFFGVVGIVLTMLGVSMTPLMLSYILGGRLENYFRTGMSYAHGDITSFLTRPFSLIFLLIGLWGLFGPLIRAGIKNIRAKHANSQKEKT